MSDPKNQSCFNSSNEHIRTVSKGVNFKTGEGLRDSFSSTDEMTAYFDALIAEDYDDEI